MPNEDRFIDSLDPDTQRRIRSDYDRFAPFLSLLGAWQQEIEEHVEQIERNTVLRLQAQLFPEGYWKFPYQTLAVPEDLKSREISDELTFTDRGTTPWTPCGAGWTLPTRLENWRIVEPAFNEYVLLCDIHYEGRRPDARLLTPSIPPNDAGQSQLAFVPAPEPIVAQLAAAPWALQHPGEPFQPVATTRYMGYLDFERSMGAAREQQRQLEAWLPPFFPYARKFLRFAVPTPLVAGETASPSTTYDWSFLPDGDGKSIRLAAAVPEEVARYFRSQQNPPLMLNAYPLAQMRVSGEPLMENPDRVGDLFKVSFMGVTNGFAAAMRELQQSGGAPRARHHATRMVATPADNTLSRSGTHNIEILCDRPHGMLADFRVRLYFGCYGEKAPVPTKLARQSSQQCAVPFPPLGSMDAPIVGYGDAGARSSWYQTLLRAPQLTQGDLLEILSQIPDCVRYLDLDSDAVSVQLDIDNRIGIEPTCWDSYLWPGRISDESLLEQRTTYLARARVAVIPLMRLIFAMRTAELPAFLEEDLLRYTASVISQYFMVGWYRVVGQRAKR